jgi:hypothetical protein
MTTTPEARTATPGAVDQAAWDKDFRVELVRVCEHIELYNKQQCDMKRKQNLLYALNEHQRRLVVTSYRQWGFPMEYEADTTTTSRAKKDTEEGRAIRLKEDERIMKIVRRISQKTEDASNPLKAFSEMPKLMGNGDQQLVANVAHFVGSIQMLWHKMPVEDRKEFVESRESMIKLIETVCKRIGPSSLRSYLENKINRIYALVGEDPEFKFQAYDFEDKSSKSTEAGDAIEDTQSDAGGDSFALDLKLLELAFECERQTAIFEGFKTLGGSVGKQQTSKEKQLDDQLGAALRKIEKLSAKVAEGEAREKDLRDQLKAARASGGGRGDGGKSYGGGNWYGSKHGGGRGYGRGGEKNRGAKPTASAVLYQRAADGTYYVVEGTSVPGSSSAGGSSE